MKNSEKRTRRLIPEFTDIVLDSSFIQITRKMKNRAINIICAIIGIALGILWMWFTGPRVIEEHQHWCDGVEVVREYTK